MAPRSAWPDDDSLANNAASSSPLANRGTRLPEKWITRVKPSIAMTPRTQPLRRQFPPRSQAAGGEDSCFENKTRSRPSAQLQNGARDQVADRPVVKRKRRVVQAPGQANKHGKQQCHRDDDSRQIQPGDRAADTASLPANSCLVIACNARTAEKNRLEPMEGKTAKPTKIAAGTASRDILICLPPSRRTRRDCRSNLRGWRMKGVVRCGSSLWQSLAVPLFLQP